ncbi:MAG: hypothetical protein ABGY09_01320 [Euryarchaeota archaeon]
MSEEPRALRVPITPRREFREALRRYVRERLLEAGAGRELAREASRSDLLKVRKEGPKGSLERGLDRVGGELRWLVDHDSFGRELSGARRDELGSFIRWNAAVRRLLAEVTHETLLEKPSLERALDVWMAGVALRRGHAGAAVGLLEELAGEELPGSPEGADDYHLSDLGEHVRDLGRGLFRTALAAHVLSNRTVGSSPVAEVVKWRLRYLRDLVDKEGRTGLLEDLFDEVRDRLERAAFDALEDEISRLDLDDVEEGVEWERLEGLEVLGVRNPEAFFRGVVEDLKATVNRVAEIAEQSESGTWIAKRLLRADTTIELGGERLGPDVYDPRWGIWEHARELLERDLGELDEAAEGVLERTLEDVCARLFEGVAKGLLGEGSKDVAQRAAELTAELAKRALTSGRSSRSYDSSDGWFGDLERLAGSIVKDVLGKRRR